ncbi:MAG: DUF2752 domain-containing protein [Clostridia bacterium]|nr:DUF2752 domain-containing protein [Clostridia bacterium]
MRKRILKIYGITLTVGLIYYLWIRLTGLSVPCLYYETTGYLCPGCGTSRMFLHLAKFDVTAAFNSNPAVFSLLVFWNAVALFCFIGKPAIFKNKRFLYLSLALSVFLLLIFCFIRNIA